MYTAYPKFRLIFIAFLRSFMIYFTNFMKQLLFFSSSIVTALPVAITTERPSVSGLSCLPD